jgi:hypothetical protein
MKKVLTTVCYLCGKPLVPPTNADHPVMKQLFAPKIRHKYNISKLLTLDVHKSCNTAYHSDEDYFVRTLMPFARGSEAGNAVYAKVLNDYRAGKEVPLTRKVFGEFDPKPGGLVLPGGKVVKRFEGERLRRVAWKMVRGLHFYHTGGEVLPERWSTVGVKLFGPDKQPTEDVLVIASATSARGTYPGVLDYKFHKFQEPNNLHYWLLLLWDRLIFRVTFHDPHCACEKCAADRTKPPPPSPPPSAHGYEPTREAAMAAFAKSWREIVDNR